MRFVLTQIASRNESAAYAQKTEKHSHSKVCVTHCSHINLRRCKPSGCSNMAVRTLVKAQSYFTYLRQRFCQAGILQVLGQLVQKETLFLRCFFGGIQIAISHISKHGPENTKRIKKESTFALSDCFRYWKLPTHPCFAAYKAFATYAIWMRSTTNTIDW